MTIKPEIADIKESFIKELQLRYNISPDEASDKQIYQVLSSIIVEFLKKKRQKFINKVHSDGKKQVYYLSMEFLMGRSLKTSLYNLEIAGEVEKMLKEYGVKLENVYEYEPDAGLGNGGLGRLAACFLDSIATLGLNGDGVGINYHLGLFKQEFKDHLQFETPNPWIQPESWLTDAGVSYYVPFKGFMLKSTLYDIDVAGYENKAIKLRLFDIDIADESIVGEGISFDKKDLLHNLTLFLYPDDSDDDGRKLRIFQQYFMVSNAAQFILDEATKKGCNLHDLADYAVIQINDTHPSMVIPEMIRLLMERGILMDEAIDIVSKTCAYTNHTILAEALEKWPIHFLEKAVPQLLPIIYELNSRVTKKYDDKSVAIIDDEKRVHMAHMDIHYGYSVNGVAYLHTEILKNTELNNFYKIYPEKFNNKTNGITFRRWLLHCDPEMTEFITSLIGPGFKKNAEELEKLGAYVNDEEVLKKLLAVKGTRKTELKNYLAKTQGIELDDNSIYDIQIKRLHEYKRQQMNALYVIHKYFEIKAGKKPARPITVIFGAKAAPAYIIAKDIIHLILCLQELIANDPEVAPYLKVVMVENYNVTLAEKLIPAADIHEQISLASKEASGTSNMKFMLNGAVAIGTMDGANVEMHQFVGDDNIYIFGESSEEVIRHYEKADYVSRSYYENDANIKRAIDFIVSDQMKAVGCAENLERLYNELLNKDWFMTLPDFEEYVATKERIYADYEDRMAWAKKMLVNISKAGFFSSDRTIAQYNEDIWHL